ncbi:hypothetical protein ACJMK2_034155 [Sinanodonta woodiana]|uniref:MICAL-like protein 2 n=1 Tax=Sinanodonta woodiana TaxID=1069815 RepID=A0ABD3WQN4_SINWO
MAMTKVKNLQLWCKKMVEGYRDVNVVDMTTSWKDGLAFCALIHKFRPDLIDYDSLSKENVHGNNQLAFEVAERELNIPAFLEADDMVAIRVPDRLSIITYVSQYYNTLHDKPQLGGPGVRKAITAGGGAVRKSGEVSSPLVISKTVDPSTPVQIERKETLGDKCVICREKVYLLERHIENGKLYHRTCFRNSEFSPTNKVIKRLLSEDKYEVQSKSRKIDDNQRKEENRTSNKKEPELSYWERRAMAKSKENLIDSKKPDPEPEGKVANITTAGKSNHPNDLKIRDQQIQSSKDHVTDFKRSDPVPEEKGVDLTSTGKSNRLNDLKIDSSTKVLPTTPTSNAKVLSKTEEVSFKTENGKGGNKSESLADKFNELSKRNLKSLQDSQNLGFKTEKGKEQMKNTPSTIMLEDGKSKGTNQSKEEQKFHPVPKPRQNVNKDNQNLLDLEKMDTSEPLVMGKSKSRPAELSGLNQDKDRISTVTDRKGFHDRPKTPSDYKAGLQLKKLSPSQSSMDSPMGSPPPLPFTAPPPFLETPSSDISPMTPVKSPLASPQGGKVSDLHAKKDEQKLLPISTNRTIQFHKERTPSPMEIDINITSPESSDTVAMRIKPNRHEQDSEKDKAVFGGLMKSLADVRKSHDVEKLKDNSSKPELDTVKENTEKPNSSKSNPISVNQSNVVSQDLKVKLPVKSKEPGKSSDQLSRASTQENQTKHGKSKGEGLKDTEKEKSKLEFISRKTDISSDQNKFTGAQSLGSKSDDKKTGMENKDAVKHGDLKTKEISNVGKTSKEPLGTKEMSNVGKTSKEPIGTKEMSGNVGKTSKEHLGTKETSGNVGKTSKEHLGTKETSGNVGKTSKEHLGTKETSSNVGKTSKEHLGTKETSGNVGKTSKEHLGTKETSGNVGKTSKEHLGTKETSGNVGKTSKEHLGTKETSDLDRHKGAIKTNQREQVTSPETSDIPSWKVDLEKKKAERPKSSDLLSQTDKTQKTEWQIEAEKRKSARIGGFIDPEKAMIDNRSNSNDKNILNKDKVTRKDHAAPSIPLSPRINAAPSIPLSPHRKEGYEDKEKVTLDKNVSNNSNKNALDDGNKVNKMEHVPPLRPSSPPKIGNRGLPGLPKANDQNKTAVTNAKVKAVVKSDSDRPHPEIKKRILPQPPQQPQEEKSPPRLKKITVTSKFLFDEADEISTAVPPVKPPRLQAMFDEKKIPLPSRPPPPMKEPAKKKMSPDEIQRQLEEIDRKLTGLELRGRKLEDAIRNAKEEEEDRLMINWFEMVSEKNDLVRTEADLIYESRELELEDEQQDIENRLRALMAKPDDQKTEEEKNEEAQLIEKKLDIVNQRSNIVDSIDEDRISFFLQLKKVF